VCLYPDIRPGGHRKTTEDVRMFWVSEHKFELNTLSLSCMLHAHQSTPFLAQESMRCLKAYMVYVIEIMSLNNRKVFNQSYTQV
jgi:hypothetical protein